MHPMKIAIFHEEEIPTLFLLRDAAIKVGFKPYLFHFQDLEFALERGRMKASALGVSLGDFSVIFCRGFWRYQNEVALLSQFCMQEKIRLFDGALHYRHSVSKMHDLVLFQKAGFRVPKTVFLEQRVAASLLEKSLGFPMVAKEDRSRKGDDVYLLKSRASLAEFLKKLEIPKKSLAAKTYQFQEFIPADFDVRVIVIGGRVLGAIKRQAVRRGEFRHNISLGGRATEIKISPKMARDAIKACEVLGFDFGGVDFITHKKTGKTYILEVNRSPGFEGFMKATGINLPEKLMNFFLRSARKHIK